MSMKPLPVCEFGTRKPHQTRDCSKVDGKKCRDLIENDSCPKDHIKLRTKDVKRPKPKVVLNTDEFKEAIKTADEGVQIIFDEIGKPIDPDVVDSALEEYFGKDESDNEPGIEALFNGQEYAIPSPIIPNEISSEPEDIKFKVHTVKKKCDLCGHTADFAYASKKCPHCGKKSLRLLEPKSIVTKRVMITDAMIDAKILEIGTPKVPISTITDPNMMPCGHYANEHELRIDNDMETPGMVFHRNICTDGHKSEWVFIGQIPDPSNCPIDEEL